MWLIVVIIVVVLIVASWIGREVAQARADRAAMLAELERIAAAFGQEPQRQPMVRCPECRTLYALEHTGCPACGSAKPAHAAVVSVRRSAIDPETLTAPPSEG